MDRALRRTCRARVDPCVTVRGEPPSVDASPKAAAVGYRFSAARVVAWAITSSSQDGTPGATSRG